MHIYIYGYMHTCILMCLCMHLHTYTFICVDIGMGSLGCKLRGEAEASGEALAPRRGPGCGGSAPRPLGL